MRPDHHASRHERRRQKRETFRHDRGPRVPVPPREALRRMLAEAAYQLRAEILEFDVLGGDFVRAIVDGLEGPPTTEWLVALIRDFRSRVAGAGFDPQDLRIEIDSPGENRLLVTPAHFERFKDRIVRVEWRAGGPTLRARLLGARDGRAVVQPEPSTPAESPVEERLLDPAEVRSIRLVP